MTVTLITGGSSGIGAATARQLLEFGHQVTITGRDKSRLDAFAAGVGSPSALFTVSGDAAEPAAAEDAVTRTIGAFGRLDNIVANAGYATHDSVGDGDPEGWRHMILTNVLGPGSRRTSASLSPPTVSASRSSRRARWRPRSPTRWAGSSLAGRGSARISSRRRSCSR